MASGFLGLWAAVPFLCPQVLLPASSRGAPCALTWCSLCTCLCPNFPFSYDIGHVGSGPTLMTSF